MNDVAPKRRSKLKIFGRVLLVLWGFSVFRFLWVSLTYEDAERIAWVSSYSETIGALLLLTGVWAAIAVGKWWVQEGSKP